jgi:ABC-type microcin C transport system duplicated ATPase subunit YejF
MEILPGTRLEVDASHLRAQARQFVNQLRSQMNVGQQELEHQVMNNLQAAYIGMTRKRERYQSYPLSLGGGSGVYQPQV